MTARFVISAAVTAAAAFAGFVIAGMFGVVVVMMIVIATCILKFAYEVEWIDWIHVPLGFAWLVVALWGEKYVAGPYALTPWTIGDAYLLGDLILAMGMLAPLLIWELGQGKERVEAVRRLVAASCGLVTATLLLQGFLRFGAEMGVRITPDPWGLGMAFLAYCAGLAIVVFFLMQVQRASGFVWFLRSSRHHHL